MPISWAMWAIGRRGWAAIRPTRVSLPAGVSRALAWAMRPPVSAVPSDSPHLTRGLTSRQQPLWAVHPSSRLTLGSRRPAGNSRRPAPVLAGGDARWQAAWPRRSRPWHGEGRAAVPGDPQGGGGGQALVAPLLPGEPPHERAVDHPRPLPALHAVLGQIALDGGCGRVASYRQGPAGRVLHGQPQGEPQVAGRPLAVLHPALEHEPLLPIAKGVLLRPHQPPLVSTAGPTTLVSHRRPCGPQLRRRLRDRVGDRAVTIPGRGGGREQADDNPVRATGTLAAAAGAVAAPVDRVRPVPSDLASWRARTGPRDGAPEVEQVRLSAGQPASGGHARPVLPNPERRADLDRHPEPRLVDWAAGVLGRDKVDGITLGEGVDHPVRRVSEAEVAGCMGERLPARGRHGARWSSWPGRAWRQRRRHRARGRSWCDRPSARAANGSEGDHRAEDERHRDCAGQYRP